MYSLPEEMVLPKLFFMVLVLCLDLGTVDSQSCELSFKDQNRELNQKKVDNSKTPKYVVFSKILEWSTHAGNVCVQRLK